MERATRQRRDSREVFGSAVGHGSRGGFRLTVSITPDPLTQKHEFIYDLDLSYLDAEIAQCLGVLARYPVRSHKPT